MDTMFQIAESMAAANPDGKFVMIFEERAITQEAAYMKRLEKVCGQQSNDSKNAMRS